MDVKKLKNASKHSWHRWEEDTGTAATPLMAMTEEKDLLGVCAIPGVPLHCAIHPSSASELTGPGLQLAESSTASFS